MAWTVSVGADVCPFFYAAKNALRVERWRHCREGAREYTTWAASRDIMGDIKEQWGWEHEGEGVYKTGGDAEQNLPTSDPEPPARLLIFGGKT